MSADSEMIPRNAAEFPLDGKVRALQRLLAPAAGERGVETIETHFAYVFLTEQHAYKLKKPVRIPPLILDTLEARHRSCDDELRLNRRFSPDVYLGMVALRRDRAGLLALEGEGEAMEWLVQMKRLPAALMLDRTMREWTVSEAAVGAVGRALAEFYRLQPAIRFAPRAYADRFMSQMESNYRELLAPDLQLDGAEVRELARLQQAALRWSSPEIGERVSSGRIVEGHGDLRPEHVCLTAPPRIIDCLEFSYDLRVLDACEELAYLAIECDLAGHAWVGRTVLRTYCRSQTDAISPQMFQLYRSHRAATRAKIVAWHVRDAT
jgi:aminoglycoside phosphotransferase family enzyme